MTPAAEDSARELESRARDQVQQSENEGHQFLEHHGRLSLTTRAVIRVLRDQSAERISLAAAGAAFWLVISALPTGIAVVSVYGLFVSPGRVASAIRLAYGLPSQRYVAARRRAYVGALAVVVLLGLLAVATPIVARRSSALVTALTIFLAAGGIIAGVGALYRFSVGTHVSARSLLPGALLSVAAMALVSVGFGAYVSASTHYTAVYGASAGAVVAMLAIYLAVYGVLLGAVLNVELGGTPATSAKPAHRAVLPRGSSGEEQGRSSMPKGGS
jgi:uncharacterized BrkB/YihY/UPF0761 family membrane protein